MIYTIGDGSACTELARAFIFAQQLSGNGIDCLVMAANKNKGDLVQGTLDMLILRTLRRDAMHGFAIAKSIEERSDDVLRVEEGSLYPALYRLELQGLVKSEWGHAVTGHRAKYYRLTSAGRKRLATEQESWARVVRAIAKVMEPAEETG